MDETSREINTAREHKNKTHTATIRIQLRDGRDDQRKYFFGEDDKYTNMNAMFLRKILHAVSRHSDKGGRHIATEIRNGFNSSLGGPHVPAL